MGYGGDTFISEEEVRWEALKPHPSTGFHKETWFNHPVSPARCSPLRKELSREATALGLPLGVALTHL